MARISAAVPSTWFVTMVAGGERFFKRFFTESEAYEYASEVDGSVTESLFNQRDYHEIW